MPENFNHTYAFVGMGHIEDYNQAALAIKEHDCVVAVDGGLIHCDKMNITPDYLGDLDFSPKKLLEKYAEVARIHKFPVDKDETDMELALQSIYTPMVTKITLFGALGNRLDHSLGNLHLIRRYPQKVYIETDKELIFAFDGPIDIECHKGQTVSFIQLGDPVTGVTSKGLQWEMNEASFNKYFMSISNICLSDHFKITLEKATCYASFKKLIQNKPGAL